MLFLISRTLFKMVLYLNIFKLLKNIKVVELFKLCVLTITS